MIAIALGANLGDRLAQLVAARQALADLLILTASSAIYETPPWGVVAQPSFLNAVCLGTTTRSPQALLEGLQAIETRLGRTPTVRWGPRVVDLDLLVYDDLVCDDPVLTLPHPRLHERAFVIVPFAEIAPTLRHPILGTTLAQIKATLDTRSIQPAAVQWA